MSAPQPRAPESAAESPPVPPAPGPRRRRRVRPGGLLLAVLAVGGLLLVWRGPEFGRVLLERRLSAAFGRGVTVGALRVLPFPLRVVVRDLRVAGERADSPPFLELRRAEAVPSLLPNWRGMRLARLHLRGLRVRVRAHEGGGDDLPRLRLPAGRSGEARIGRLVVEQAEVLVDHRRVPLELDLPAVSGSLREVSGGALAGRLSFAPGRLRFGGRPELELGSEVEMSLRGGRLEVASGRLRTERTDLSYRGALQLSPSVRGEFAVVGPVDLAVLDRHVLDSGLALRGHARYVGHALVEGSRLSLQGRLEGTHGEFDGVAVPRYSGEVSWKEGRLQVRGLELSALEGRARIDLEVPPAPASVRLEAALSGTDAEGLARLVFDVGAAGLGGALTGEAKVHWPRGRRGRTSGEVALEIAPREGARTGLGGRLVWRGQQGRQLLEETVLRTSSVQVRASGTVEEDGRADLRFDADSSDLAAADELLQRVRRALGAPAPLRVEMGGRGSFRGRWRGTLPEPVFEGRFSGHDMEYLGVVWGRAEWAGVLTSEELRSHSLVLRKGEAELWLDGDAQTGLYGEQDAVDVQLRLRRWPSADLLSALRWDLPLEAELSGEARLRGHRSRPFGEVRLQAERGRYAGVPFGPLALLSSLAGGRTEVRDGRVAVGSGRLLFHGSLTAEGLYDAGARLEDVELSELLPAVPPDLRPGGRLEGDLLLQGPIARPRLRASLRARRVFLGDEGLGALEASLVGSGDGQVRLSAECRSPRVDLSVEGMVAAAAPYTSSLRLRARETSLDPFLRARFPSLPAGTPLVASAEAELSGPLQRPRELALHARLGELALHMTDYPVRALEPATLRLSKGQLSLHGLHLGGEGTDLKVQGDLDLFGEGPLAVEARGEADLRVLSLLTREMRGRGGASLVLAVSGTRRAPRLEGTLEVEGASLRVRRFPHGIEDLRGTLRFTHEGAHLPSATGTVAGAPVLLRGQAGWQRGGRLTFDLRAQGEGLALRYPEGLRSVVDGELRFFGDERVQWLSGQVHVRQAVWSRRYDVASELLAERATLEEAGVPGRGVRLDVKVSAPGTLKVDNNLATLQARADLLLQGTTAAPVVLGRAEVDRGRVYFQGNTYLIRRGSIDFANPRRIDPLFDIEAETRIQSYRITLRVSGTLERVYPTLSSDPPLAGGQVAILSLLAGADERAVASMDSRRDEAQARLAVTGAATLAAGRIAEEVGLERGAERLFGLSRFSIDPSAVRGDVTNPTARLTVGKRITPEMAIVYSADLRGTEERLVSVEYALTERVSLLLTRSDPTGGFGFDLRLRQSR